jgi:hypothetical protein
MTDDATLRDQAVAALKQTTVGYRNKYWTVPPAGSQWAKGLELLAQIGAVTPLAGLDPRYPAELRSLYDSWQPPAAPTKTVTTQAELDALTIGVGDWAVVEPLPGGAAYTGQHNCDWQLPAGKISACIRFAPGVTFRGPVNSDPNVVSLLNIVGASGLLIEGPADLSNPGWNEISLEDCTDVIVRGVIAHGGAAGGIGAKSNAAGSSNVWVVECEMYDNGHQAACWAGSEQDYYLKGAHSASFGDAPGPCSGGGLIGCHIHDQHTGYGVQLYAPGPGQSSGQTIDFCTFTNIDGKVSGVPPVRGTASDEAGCGIMAYGGGVINLLVGPNNTYVNCAFTDFALEAGSTLAPGSSQPTYTA